MLLSLLQVLCATPPRAGVSPIPLPCQSVDSGRLIDILVQRARATDEFTRLTAVTWVSGRDGGGARGGWLTQPPACLAEFLVGKMPGRRMCLLSFSEIEMWCLTLPRRSAVSILFPTAPPVGVGTTS